MPKATLTFQLPEEQEEHDFALNGWRYKAALTDLDERLRGLSKHGTAKDRREFSAERAREWLHEALETRGISGLY